MSMRQIVTAWTLVIAATVATHAWAQQVIQDAPRTIDFTAAITDQDGKPFTECVKMDGTKCLEETPITLGTVSLRALTGHYADEQNLSAQDQVHRAALSLKIYKARDAALSSDDISEIKKVIFKAGFSNLLVPFRACVLLDPTCAPKDK